MNIVVFLLVSVITCTLTACGKSHQAAHPKTQLITFEVKSSSLQKPLHFTGTIQPLKESTLTSPADGVLENIHFHYGQFVRKGQPVYTLNSQELQKQYNDTLTEYLKAKDSYSISRAKFTGTEELWQAGLLAKNNYLSEKSGLNTARITLIQASKKLTELFEKMGETNTPNFSKLSFNEFDKVRLELTNKHNLIALKAPSNGVLLYPPKANDEKAMSLTVGAAIKTGQVLALVGDLSGVTINIDIPEIDLDKVKPGMPALIKGVAFGKETLKGRLVAVNAQASVSNNAALPSFTALVEVSKLTKAQQATIKVGMSASIELIAQSSDKLFVPIAAVKQVYGQSMVQIKAADGKIYDRPVVTGEARADSVAIDSGLNIGDVVVYESPGPAQ